MFSPRPRRQRQGVVPRQSVGTAGRLHWTRARKRIVWGGATDQRNVYWDGRRGDGVDFDRGGKNGWVFAAPGAGGRRCGSRSRADRDPGRGLPGCRRWPALREAATDGKQLGSSTPRRTDTANKGARARRCDRHCRRGDRGRNGLHRLRVRSAAARRRAPRAAGLRRGRRPRGITARAALLLTMSACTASTGGPVVLSIPRRPCSVSRGRRVDRLLRQRRRLDCGDHGQ